MTDVEDRCRVCDCILTDKNWLPGNRKQNNKRCKYCEREYQNSIRKSWGFEKRLRQKISASLKDHRRKGIETFGSIDEYYNLYDGKCAICECDLEEFGDNWELSGSLDRINNEDYMSLDNVQWVCRSCNATKGARTMDEFMNYIEMIYNKRRR